jgi:hypothetical protein
MSMVLSFTLVTPEELERAFQDPEWADRYLEQLFDEGRSYCYLEKAWAGIQFLLDAADVPIDIYEDGHLIDDGCVYFGWDPAMVAEAAEALRGAPFDVLATHYDPAKLTAADVYPRVWYDDTLDYLRENHASLVTFFEEAAAAKAGAIREFNC